MKPVLQFLFPRRLHRINYFVRLMLFNVSPLFFYLFNPQTNQEFFVGLYVVLAVYGLCFIVLPRLRDIDMSGWWLLVCFIPLLNILLGFILLFRAPKFSSSRPAEGEQNGR
jgi:uncharacterized membrane protein YhaH (DUF805 family)